MQEISIYTMTIAPMTRALENLEKILDKAVMHAGMKKADATHLLQDRLVFDQFPFVRQVQIASDNAKAAAARLSGQEPPKFEDVEKTPEELKARIHKTLGYVRGIDPDAFKGAEDRTIVMPHYYGGGSLTGYEYATTYILPNFYFHVATAYAILRKNGVDIGKGDYLGALPLK